MAVHLSKYLPSKKSTTAFEQDNFEKIQSISISKALNPNESALKVKHARATIIGTFRTHGAHAFWPVVLRQPLMENRFTAWKFCHLLHKILREGHPLCIDHSLKHRKMLLELGKLWGHLPDGYGKCIRNYTKLLITKMDFHERNPRFPGNLVLSKNELELIGGNDINIYFQLGVEMFDYLDDILALQATIFTSINTFHHTSMTSAGQCRLAPLIPLIQDSNQLYDFVVRIMFKLHSHLPNDLLQGHRERFQTIFTQLKKFYDQSRNLQFFVNLITVPILPEHAPNFSSKVDFGSYVPPVVVVPEPEPEPIVDNLVDMSIPVEENNRSPVEEPTAAVPVINFERLLQERDELIRHLQGEIDRLGKSLKSMAENHREQTMLLEDKIGRLSMQLAEAQEELVALNMEKDELDSKARTVHSIEQNASVELERAKASEEKFQKFKTMYTDVRDQHIKLLRQHGEITKQLSTIKKQAAENIAEKESLQKQYEELKQEQTQTIEELQKTSQSVEQEQVLREKLEKLQKDYETFQVKFSDFEIIKCTEIANLQSQVEYINKTCEDYKNQNLKQEELLTSAECVEKAKYDLEMKLEEISVEKQNITAQLDGAQKSISVLENELKEKLDDFEKLVEGNKTVIAKKDAEFEQLQKKYEENEQKFKTTNAILERLSEDKSNIECDFQDLLNQQDELEEKHKNAMQTIVALESSLQDSKIHGETCLRALLESCIKASEKLAVRAMSENEFTSAVGTSSYFMMIAEEVQDVLKELGMVFEKFTSDETAVEGLARKTVLTGHLLATIHLQGITICNLSPDIECGERITEEIKNFSQDVMLLFDALQTSPPSNKVGQKITDVKEKLNVITTMIHDLSKNVDNTGQIGDLVESELSGMDKAIEEAAAKIVEMLSKSRASDSGIKLEVNEKILDACTSLMQSIRILVQKSRLLQAEIVLIGKGTASAKEFYKRNHQWTEGLISAAKSIAQGANLLVTAANKTVSGDAKHHLDIIVAAQEIAACTAQLVVASRVKAPRGSNNLSALSQASKSVTQATGAVVATAKDCTQQMEDSQDLDLTQLTVHQAKTLEMEIQVKVLELEQALQMERLRLAAFRRKNYQNSEEK